MRASPGQDRNGNPVTIGDRVRVLEIRPSILARLANPELADVSSMLGQVVEVFDVYENGQVWVTMAWPRGEGRMESHSIAVDPWAIEFVSRGDHGEA